MQRVKIDELKTIKITTDTIADANNAAKSRECCYNKDNECQLGYGKCSSNSECFTFE